MRGGSQTRCSLCLFTRYGADCRCRSLVGSRWWRWFPRSGYFSVWFVPGADVKLRRVTLGLGCGLQRFVNTCSQ